MKKLNVITGERFYKTVLKKGQIYHACEFKECINYGATLIDCEWDGKNGVWKDGAFLFGTWLKGTWENGIWHDGTWCEGYWNKGHIFDPHRVGKFQPNWGHWRSDEDYIFSPISPKHYFRR